MNGTFRYAWKDGNLISAVGSDLVEFENGAESRVMSHNVNMSYTTYENKSTVDIYTAMGVGSYSYFLISGTASSAGILQKLGLTSLNLIDTITETEIDGNTEYRYFTRFEYEFDKEGYVTKVITYSTSQSSGGKEASKETFKIEYKTL